MDSFTSTLWIGPFPVEGVSREFSLLLVPCFIEILNLMQTASVDRDKTRRSVASDHSLHCHYPFSWTLGLTLLIRVYSVIVALMGR